QRSPRHATSRSNCELARDLRTGRFGAPQGRGSVMLKRSSQVLCVWFLVWDLVLTTAAWVGAYYLRFESGWIPIRKDPLDIDLCGRTLPLVILLSAVAYRLTGQYTIHRLRRFREEMVGVIKGTALLSLLVMSTTFYLHDPYESRATMLLFSLLTVGG